MHRHAEADLLVTAGARSFRARARVGPVPSVPPKKPDSTGPLRALSLAEIVLGFGITHPKFYWNNIEFI